MKRLTFLLMLFAACTTAMAQTTKDYGKPVKAQKAVELAKVQSQLQAKTEWKGVVKGTVLEVCKREGCWLRLDDGSAEGILVRMKDHDFTVPKNIDGKTVLILGTATKTTTSVKALQHYAEDAGKTPEEIAAIKEPKTAITIEAVGVKVLD
jgi:hypothetical protein